jgi:hypothetical protein
MGANDDVAERQAVGQAPSRADAEQNLCVRAAINKVLGLHSKLCFSMSANRDNHIERRYGRAPHGSYLEGV